MAKHNRAFVGDLEEERYSKKKPTTTSIWIGTDDRNDSGKMPAHGPLGRVGSGRDGFFDEGWRLALAKWLLVGLLDTLAKVEDSDNYS